MNPVSRRELTAATPWAGLHRQRLGSRSYFLARPAAPAPLLLAFHGRAQEVDGTKGEVLGIERDFVGMSGLLPACQQRGIAVAFLEGQRRRGDGERDSRGGRDWSFDAGPDGGWPGINDNIDVRFVYAVVNELESRDVHDGRIIIAGFSNGASFAHYAATVLGGSVVGAIFHSGGVKKPLETEGPDGKFPVAVACETGGVLDMVKRRRVKLSERVATMYRSAGCAVQEFYKRDSHRWRAEENDAYFRAIGF